MGSHEESYSSTSPPLPVGDLLVVGVAGGEEGARGFLDAYRASTGERAWRWYSIPKRGEKGWRHGSARRSNTAAARRGCQARTIRSST